jgi:hypothetical protein
MLMRAMTVTAIAWLIRTATESVTNLKLAVAKTLLLAITLLTPQTTMAHVRMLMRATTATATA